MFPAKFKLTADGQGTLMIREGRGLMTMQNATKQMVFSHSLEQMTEALHSYRLGAFIQDAFPFLSADEREFVLSGTTPDEWAQLFPQEDEDATL